MSQKKNKKSNELIKNIECMNRHYQGNYVNTK